MIIEQARADILTCITALLYSSASAVVAESSDLLFNDDWRFIAHPTVEPAGLPTEGWADIELPHSWNASDPVDAVPGYRRGVGWYRKTLRLDDPAPGERHLLHFEAANMKAVVYVNGRHAGGHVGGYLGFTVEIGQWLKPDIDNEILVRVDNGVDRNLIPSQKSDFVLYGGLTRDVHLLTRPQSYIAGLRIDTPDVSADSGTAQVSARIDGDTPDGAGIRYALFGPGGESLGEIETNSFGPIDLPAVNSPQLWSPDNPALYRVEATLVDTNGKALHSLEEHFGFRWF